LNTLTTSSMYVLTGVCLYAAMHHLDIGLRPPRNRAHLLFSVLCLSVALLVLAQIQAYLAQHIPEFVSALRWNLSFILISFMLFHWFIAECTDVKPKPFLYLMTALFTVVLVINLFAPNTLQYREITHLNALRLPWGEVISEPVAHNSRAFTIGVLAVLTDFGFAIYALVIAWRREHRRTILAMLLAIGVFFLAALEGIAVRAAAFHFVHLGWFGFLAMVIMMSMALTRDTQKRLRESERRFRSLVEQSPLSIQVVAPDGHIRQVNPAWETLWGTKLEQLSGYNLLHDQQFIDKGIMPYIEKGFAGNASEIPTIVYNPATNPGTSAAQHDRWIHSYIYPIKDEAGKIHDVILMHEDVTEKKRIEDAVRLIAAGVSSAVDEQFFQQLVLNLAKVFEADYAFIALQDKHVWTRLNMLAAVAKGEITTELNFSLACVPFMRIMQEGTCVFPHDVQALFPEECALTDTGVQALIGTAICENEHQRGLLVVMHSKPIEYVEQAREILDIFAVRAGNELQRQRAQDHIRRLAYQDYLTGLANRAQLHERLTAALQQAKREQRQGALLLIDLDHFKTINDALGHDVGDEVLRAVGKRISEACEADVLLARLGGDEFVALMLSDAHLDQAHFQPKVFMQAQRILAQLANPIFTGERAFSIGASIGIVRFPEDDETDLDVLRHADMALYQAKSKGRGNIQLYLPDLEVAATNRLQLEAGLRHAVDQQEMELYYQPQIDAQGNAIGAEVLLRWHHPSLGDVPPTAFIPVAEDTGLIHHIGAWVFDQACASLTRWLREGVPFGGHLSINVCPWQFARPDFVADVREVLQRHNVDPQRLMLELTETALLYDLNETIEKLKALRFLGLRIALDDFGTGYSSLAYLRDLPLDQLKIDKNFISELSSTVEHPLVGSMIAIGKHMKLAVVAEGVETESQRNELIELGCEHFQGYLFCRPLPESAFITWLNQHYPRSRLTTQG
jgi:diguanylate cyclase (GGDEF)-like protein/PAS domain S-box-containing protein